MLKEHPARQLSRLLTLRVVVVSLPGTAGTGSFYHHTPGQQKVSPPGPRNLYHYRWTEEEFFKTIKEHLRAEEFRGKSVQFIDQELLSTYLYYILTRIMMLEAARQQNLPVAKLETKAALEAVARYLDRLWIAETLEQCRELLTPLSGRNLLEKIPPRPGRKFPRKSKSRHGKWANKWA